MSLTIHLPPGVERQVRKEADRTGRTPEHLVSELLAERFPPSSDRARRVAVLLDRWDAEDAEHPELGPVVIPPRASFRVPELG